MRDAILALNAGSSSIKFGLYDIVGGGLTPVARGTIEIGRSPHWLRSRPMARLASIVPFLAKVWLTGLQRY